MRAEGIIFCEKKDLRDVFGLKCCQRVGIMLLYPYGYTGIVATFE